jgi:CDP-glucose 4,6-dehydratase
MTWAERPVLVTGCTGLVGSWLTGALVERGARVVGLVRDSVQRTHFTRSGLPSQITMVRGDLSDISLLERILNEYEIDTVFHLAAQAIVPIAYRNPLSTFETNIRGTYLLLEACRLHQLVKRIVVASSDKAYGDQPVLPYTEDMPLHGAYPYDVAKCCLDLLCQSYWKTYQLPVCITRCANIFGGGDLQWTRLIPRTIRAALFDQAPTVRSDGTFHRDYLYVKNIVDGYLTLAEQLEEKHLGGEAFNFGSERPLTVLEMVAIILKKMDRTHLIPQVLDTAMAEIRNQYLCTDKAVHRLGWLPRYSLESGLDETIAWYTDYFKEAPAWDAQLSASS